MGKHNEYMEGLKRARKALENRLDFILRNNEGGSLEAFNLKYKEIALNNAIKKQA